MSSQPALLATASIRAQARSVADWLDLFVAREALEYGAARRAIDGPPVDLSPLRAALEHLREAVGLDAVVAADARFHRELVALADSPRLSAMHEQLSAASHMLFRHHRGYPGVDWVDEHELLLRAVQRRDRHAPELVAEHVRRAALLIADELRGPAPAPLRPARFRRRLR